MRWTLASVLESENQRVTQRAGLLEQPDVARM